MRSPSLEFPKTILTVGPRDFERIQVAFEGHSEVTRVETGADACEALGKQRPAFIIVSAELEDMPIAKWLRAVRRTFQGACVPILVVAETPDLDGLTECFSEGADDFIVAPFSREELRMRVSAIFVRQRVARDMSPLTGFPGNLALKTEIERRLRAEETFTVLHVDLDHFKAFNDSRGFDAGDEAIKVLADCLVDVASSPHFSRAFLGHVGGDDFVVLLKSGDGRSFGETLFKHFDEAKKRFYSNEELRTGRVEIRSRKGELISAPLLSISIGGVTTARPGVRDVRRLTHVAAEVKSAAKDIEGNALVIDRRLSSAVSRAPALSRPG